MWRIWLLVWKDMGSLPFVSLVVSAFASVGASVYFFGGYESLRANAYPYDINASNDLRSSSVNVAIFFLFMVKPPYLPQTSVRQSLPEYRRTAACPG